MRKETSILLPTARVDLFLKDPATIEAARALSQDWRYARVSINIHEGDVDHAIRAYGTGVSPAMILVETDTTDESFTNRLGELSGLCDEGTSAVVIGPVNDVNLYRSLTAMGVSDYLVRPVPIETLSEVIAGALVEKLGTSGSRLIAMVGSKGGVGVSSLAQILSWGISDTLSQKTFLFDAAGGWSTLGVGMGFEPTSGTSEAMRAVTNKDTDAFRRMLFHPNDKLAVLGTGAESMLDYAAQGQSFEDILNTAMASYPVVVADLSGAPASVKKTILTRAHETILVATPTLSSLRAARTLMNEIKKLVGGTHSSIHLLINMAGIAPGKEIGKGDIQTAMDIAPSALIPFDPKSFIGAENEGRKLGADKAMDSILSMLLPLVQKTIGKDGAAPLQSSPAVLDILGKLKFKK